MAIRKGFTHPACLPVIFFSPLPFILRHSLMYFRLVVDFQSRCYDLSNAEIIRLCLHTLCQKKPDYSKGGLRLSQRTKRQFDTVGKERWTEGHLCP